MRRSPWNNTAFLSSAKQLLHVPLSSESIHNACCAPVVSFGAQHAPAEAGLLQLAARSIIDTPAQRRGFVCSAQSGYHESRQIFAGERLFDSLLQLAMRDAARVDQPLELTQFLLRLAQRDRD